ncbi:hypothetical protein PHET_06959 [Paragonimus heterotremus]|uniref:Uncharacterized protein n=1 Tax=Paragonimus heterotremus TaxID=100268 RepID=A0A8J4WHA1_9TREM|nr:hypothetical protein PHET_06959 [Paragonimus heterotremus]
MRGSTKDLGKGVRECILKYAMENRYAATWDLQKNLLDSGLCDLATLPTARDIAVILTKHQKTLPIDPIIIEDDEEVNGHNDERTCVGVNTMNGLLSTATLTRLGESIMSTEGKCGKRETVSEASQQGTLPVVSISPTGLVITHVGTLCATTKSPVQGSGSIRLPLVHSNEQTSVSSAPPLTIGISSSCQSVGLSSSTHPQTVSNGCPTIGPYTTFFTSPNTISHSQTTNQMVHTVSPIPASITVPQEIRPAGGQEQPGVGIGNGLTMVPAPPPALISPTQLWPGQIHRLLLTSPTAATTGGEGGSLDLAIVYLGHNCWRPVILPSGFNPVGRIGCQPIEQKSNVGMSQSDAVTTLANQ